MDQSGFDDRLDYPYGYCHHSERFPADKLGYRTQRVSVMSAWREGEVIAPMVFEGYTDGKLVCNWIEQMLLPEMLPGQILVLDNASFHPKTKIEKLLEKAHCQVLFLPPYSPDLNKIEKYWGNLKRRVKQLMSQGYELEDAIDCGLRCLS